MPNGNTGSTVNNGESQSKQITAAKLFQTILANIDPDQYRGLLDKITNRILDGESADNVRELANKVSAKQLLEVSDKLGIKADTELHHIREMIKSYLTNSLSNQHAQDDDKQDIAEHIANDISVKCKDVRQLEQVWQSASDPNLSFEAKVICFIENVTGIDYHSNEYLPQKQSAYTQYKPSLDDDYWLTTLVRPIIDSCDTATIQQYPVAFHHFYWALLFTLYGGHDINFSDDDKQLLNELKAQLPICLEALQQNNCVGLALQKAAYQFSQSNNLLDEEGLDHASDGIKQLLSYIDLTNQHNLKNARSIIHTFLSEGLGKKSLNEYLNQKHVMLQYVREIELEKPSTFPLLTLSSINKHISILNQVMRARDLDVNDNQPFQELINDYVHRIALIGNKQTEFQDNDENSKTLSEVLRDYKTCFSMIYKTPNNCSSLLAKRKLLINIFQLADHYTENKCINLGSPEAYYNVETLSDGWMHNTVELVDQVAASHDKLSQTDIQQWRELLRLMVEYADVSNSSVTGTNDYVLSGLISKINSLALKSQGQTLNTDQLRAINEKITIMRARYFNLQQLDNNQRTRQHLEELLQEVLDAYIELLRTYHQFNDITNVNTVSQDVFNETLGAISSVHSAVNGLVSMPQTLAEYYQAREHLDQSANLNNSSELRNVLCIGQLANVITYDNNRITQNPGYGLDELRSERQSPSNKRRKGGQKATYGIDSILESNGTLDDLKQNPKMLARAVGQLTHSKNRKQQNYYLNKFFAKDGWFKVTHDYADSLASDPEVISKIVGQFVDRINQGETQLIQYLDSMLKQPMSSVTSYMKTLANHPAYAAKVVESLSKLNHKKQKTYIDAFLKRGSWFSFQKNKRLKKLFEDDQFTNTISRLYSFGDLPQQYYQNDNLLYINDSLSRKVRNNNYFIERLSTIFERAGDNTICAAEKYYQMNDLLSKHFEKGHFRSSDNIESLLSKIKVYLQNQGKSASFDCHHEVQEYHNTVDKISTAIEQLQPLIANVYLDKGNLRVNEGGLLETYDNLLDVLDRIPNFSLENDHSFCCDLLNKAQANNKGFYAEALTSKLLNRLCWYRQAKHSENAWLSAQVNDIDRFDKAVSDYIQNMTINTSFSQEESQFKKLAQRVLDNWERLDSQQQQYFYLVCFKLKHHSRNMPVDNPDRKYLEENLGALDSRQLHDTELIRKQIEHQHNGLSKHASFKLFELFDSIDQNHNVGEEQAKKVFLAFCNNMDRNFNQEGEGNQDDYEAYEQQLLGYLQKHSDWLNDTEFVDRVKQAVLPKLDQRIAGYEHKVIVGQLDKQTADQLKNQLNQCKSHVTNLPGSPESKELSNARDPKSLSKPSSGSDSSGDSSSALSDHSLFVRRSPSKSQVEQAEYKLMNASGMSGLKQNNGQ